MEHQRRGGLRVLVAWLGVVLANARLADSRGVRAPAPRSILPPLDSAAAPRPAMVTAPALASRAQLVRDHHHGNATMEQQRLLGRDVVTTELSTCGYLNGDPKKIRTANDGFDCRVDTANGLWGFCPTTVIAATDCGLAGSCVDSHACSRGCGLTDRTALTTFTCDKKDFCSLALLTFGVDQTYSYVACGGVATTDHFLISPTTKPAPTTTITIRDLSSTSTPTSSSSSSSQSSTSTSSSLTSPPATGAAPSSPSVTSAAPPSPTHERPSSHASGGGGGGGGGNNIGPIIGGIIGGIALLCGSAVAIVYLLRRNRASDAQKPGAAEDASTAKSAYAYYGGGAQGVHELGGGGALPPVYELSSVQQHGRYAELG